MNEKRKKEIMNNKKESKEKKLKFYFK